MADNAQDTTASRDGTSQAARVLPELDPDYAQIDGRTTRDLLAFARAYAGELRYFPQDDPDTAQGDWSGFVGSEADVDAAAEYAKAPEDFPAQSAAPYARPHFALFLAFLELLGSVRAQLNTLTRRHLEFFYRDVLKMVRKPAVPDAVHVLADLENGTDELLLAAGTALQAGKDSLGRDLVYRTANDLVANQAEVARISSVHAEIDITGLKEASRQYLVGGTRDNAFMSMLQLALGQPNPGDPLPVDLKASPPLYPGVPPANQPNPQVTFDVLTQAQNLIGMLATTLGMPLFDDFRSLMRLKSLRQSGDAGDWAQINSLLEKAGKKRDPNFKLNTQDPTNFQQNLLAALNISQADFAHLFDGLPEVKSMEDAYAAYAKRPDVQAFIQAKLYMSLDDFRTMMQIKTLMDNQWEQINQLLERAGKQAQANPAFVLPGAARAAHDFDAKLAAALPGFRFSGGLDAYYQAFLSIERYFYTSAENFQYLMSVANRKDDSSVDEWGWDKLYDIVGAAHDEMIYARRRDVLAAIAQPGIQAKDYAKALDDMLAFALGESLKIDDAMQRLDALGTSADDQDYLRAIRAKTEAAPDWDYVYTLLEVAQRNRENFKPPAPEKVEWRNLYAAPDATKVLAPSAQPDAQALPRWETFGRVEPHSAPSASFGWAMGSPLLALGEGRRRIDLTLGFSGLPGDFDVDAMRTLFAPAAGKSSASFSPFKFQLSTAQGWLEPDAPQITWNDPSMGGYPAVPGVDTSTLHALTFSITLSETQAALTPLSCDVHGIDTPFPVLGLLLKPVWDQDDASYVTYYQALRGLWLMRARLAVSVTGLSGLHIRNDQGTLDPKKPFEPFGTSPAVGSRFYLGHPELVGKKLDSVGFNITWMGVPANLATQYQNYAGNLGNASFKARVSLFDKGVLRDFSPPLGLFNAADATKLAAATLAPPADQGNPADAVADADDVAQWSRYLLWELTPTDFQHSVYPNVALQQSLALAGAMANKAAGATVNTAGYQVNPPYTPKIKSLTADYAASAEVALDAGAAGTVPARAYHVHPFGYAELKADGARSGAAFLPRYDLEGELYIGLSNVGAPQRVSLLFQMAEGSANPDLPPQAVQWSYLSGNAWLTLQDGSLISDGTRGLINSGIVELALKPAQPNTLLPGDLYWIRAAIARYSDSVCDMVALHPNAVLAVFSDQGNAPDHLSTPLPAERITGPVTPVPGLTRVLQPYSSFGGKMAEQDSSFYVRVSERLRHKQRALTAWDYERLVLEKFPDLYKVKCLRADPLAHPHDPGLIELVVIPDIRNRLPFDPFEPKAPADLISDVETFLRDKIPPCASVNVKNAHYVPVKVRCGVRFMPGVDEGFCRRRLNAELNRFLSPWAYEEGADLVIGGSVYANSLINFIDRRDYVDYVAEFKLFTADDGKTFRPVDETDDYHATAKRPDDVLVAAREHEFDVISDADYRVEEFAGIDYMRIELDFIVA
jgi:hypothetical protein